MPSSTPGQAIPYALDADPRALWPETSQDLAERVDTLVTQLAADVAGATEASWLTAVNSAATTLAASDANVVQGFGGGANTDDWGFNGSTFTYLSGPFRLFLVHVRLETAAANPPARERMSLLRLMVNGASEAGRCRQVTQRSTDEVTEVGTHHITALVGMNPNDTLHVTLTNQSTLEPLLANADRGVSIIGVK